MTKKKKKQAKKILQNFTNSYLGNSFFLLRHFTHFCKIAITRVYVFASILLKFGTHIGGLKANPNIDFWVDLINIEEVTSNFTHKLKSNFC